MNRFDYVTTNPLVYFQVGWQHLCDTAANDLRISNCGKQFLCEYFSFDRKFDMILFFVLQENDYHGGIFLPMYDQSNTQLPANAQPTDQNPNTTDYRRNCGVPLAFFEPQTQGNTFL